MTTGTHALDDSILHVIKTGDLSRLSDEQQLTYYKYECSRLGLDPSSRPFAWLRLNGRTVLYAERRCADMLARQLGITTMFVVSPEIRDFGGTKVLYCVVRAIAQDGRTCEDIGCVTPGSDMVNGIMKAATKAMRRATLRLAGWGGMDESEVETVPGAVQIGDLAAPPKQLRGSDVSGDVAPPQCVVDGAATMLSGGRLEPMQAAGVLLDHWEGLAGPEDPSGQDTRAAAWCYLSGLCGGSASLERAVGSTLEGYIIKARTVAELKAVGAMGKILKAQGKPAASLRAVYSKRLAELTKPPPEDHSLDRGDAWESDIESRESSSSITLVRDADAVPVDRPAQDLRDYVASKPNIHALENGLAKHVYPSVDQDLYMRIVSDRFRALGQSDAQSVNSARRCLQARRKSAA